MGDIGELSSENMTWHKLAEDEVVTEINILIS
jgi:hypothetical protein